VRVRYLAWRQARANRKAEKTMVKTRKALDRLHGRSPRSASSSWLDADDLGIGDMIAGGVVRAIEALFKIFD
jgi:hypothetical protein